MRKEICYITDDGAIFLSPNKAKQHEVGLALREIYSECPLVEENGKIVHVDWVVAWVNNHLEELETVFKLKERQ